MGKRINTATWEEKHNRWHIKVQKDGERKNFYSGTPGRTGQRECNAKADAWLDSGLVATDTRADALFADWLIELQANTGTAHWRKYKGFWEKWISPRVGRKKISELTEQHIQNVVTDAHRAGLSKKTLENLRACMVAFIKYARKCKATSLVIENVYIPRNAPVGERAILQPNELRTLFSVDTTVMRGKPVPEPLVYAFRLEVITGLRPGELLGLEWKDIQGRKVTIRQSYNNSGEFTKGKNKNALRSFTMPVCGAEVMEGYKQSLGSQIKFSKFIFPSEDGGPLSQSTYRKRWIRYRDSNGLSLGIRLYDLRHTFVSIFKELPEGLLKKLVGHSIDMDTYATYSHEIEGDDEKTAALMQETLQRLLGGTN